MRYTASQRRTFAALVLTTTLIAFWLVSVDVDPVWLVVYAGVFPVVFRLLLVASSHFEPATLWQSGRVWRAMRRSEIVLHYQPKVALATGSTAAVEALARWDHPRRGLLPPAAWLRATENPWLEMRFCRYVLDVAIRQARDWRLDGHDLLIQVNVSPRCFIDRRFPQYVKESLERWEVPPSFISLEITEATLELPDRALAIAEQITTLGVSLSLDDFGIGHSSMRRLVRLPFSELKIDKSFVMGMLGSDRHQAVVRSAISLGHGLQMDIVAEGVENAATRDRLTAMGCDIAQGFHFSRALPPGELLAYVAATAVPEPVRVSPPRTPRPSIA
ncbi:MAG: putative signaling protein [Solirubrobacterales bacterium]|nr:putative signaling protein [Solirubrobacterales bacterium]